MAGLAWKRNADAILERRRRFFTGRLRDGILASLPAALDTEGEWRAFERKWKQVPPGAPRPFPSNEEIFDRETIGWRARAAVEDDVLPVVYSILDAGESMVSGMFGAEMQFLHRRRGPAFSTPRELLPDYAGLPRLRFSLENAWARRFLSIQEHFESASGDRLAQHPCLTMDALNFACELRGATQTYLDIYEHPAELRRLMEIGLDFNLRFQDAHRGIIAPYRGGCFAWLAGWVPFPNAAALSVDAYVICSPAVYAEFGFEYQARLIRHCGRGLMHFHCNRTDLAAEVARLPGLALFQFGGDPQDPVPEIDHLPAMRQAVGDIPIQIYCPLPVFVERLKRQALLPNVWYCVGGGPLATAEANKLMDKARAYRA